MVQFPQETTGNALNPREGVDMEQPACREIPLGRRNQVTIPKELIPKDVTSFLCHTSDRGDIILEPMIKIPRSQAYFWSKRWQRGEMQADKDIKNGRTVRARSLSEALRKRRRKSK